MSTFTVNTREDYTTFKYNYDNITILIWNLSIPLPIVNLRNLKVLQLNFRSSINYLNLINLEELILNYNSHKYKSIDYLGYFKKLKILKIGEKINQSIENLDLKNLDEFQYKNININMKKKEIKFNNDILYFKYDFETILNIIQNHIHEIYLDNVDKDNFIKFIDNKLIEFLNNNNPYSYQMILELKEKINKLENIIKNKDELYENRIKYLEDKLNQLEKKW